MDRNLGANEADKTKGKETYGMYYQWGRKDPAVRIRKSELDSGGALGEAGHLCENKPGLCHWRTRTN